MGSTENLVSTGFVTSNLTRLTRRGRHKDQHGGRSRPDPELEVVDVPFYVITRSQGMKFPRLSDLHDLESHDFP